MLESIRQNLKGTLVVIVIIIFIVPMVISGVGTSFLGGSSATDAAVVDGESISKLTLDRAIRSERARLLQAGGIDVSSPLLEESNLKANALERLTRRASLIANGKRHSMAMSDASYVNSLMGQEAFMTDGNFDEQKFRSLLAQSGLTSSSYKKELAEDLIVQQQITGLDKSAFVSDFEFSQIAKLTHQKRSFYAIKIPKELVSSQIQVLESDLLEYYEANQETFRVPEKVKIEYVEINVEDLAKNIEVNEQDIRDQYEAEIANFSSSDTYSVAHILVEDSEQSTIDTISEALAAGTDFSELAKTYSDDISSSETGGELGILTLGMFPTEFEEAVLKLEQGQVSAPVKTEAGTHFIKALSKQSTDVPSYESRESDIRNTLAMVSATEQYDIAVDQLGELTFSSDDLNDASQQLNLSVQSTEFFDRSTVDSGSILAFEKVRTAAFSDEVKLSGHNSNTLELSPTRTVVLRVSETQDTFVTAFDDVRVALEKEVVANKTRLALDEQADELKTKIEAGGSPEELAQLGNQEFTQFDLVKRNTPSIDFTTLSLAFGAAKPNTDVSFAEGNSMDGDKLLIAVTEVVDGSLSDLAQGEKEAIVAQLSSQSSSLEMSSYFEYVYTSSDIKTY